MLTLRIWYSIYESEAELMNFKTLHSLLLDKTAFQRQVCPTCPSIGLRTYTFTAYIYA